ncbi:MAG TPA: DUF2798 domain-containing protein, partial [Devosia sp.]|nr:DUF2798 domain-containing protein [Devosia sp.]
PTGTNPCSGLVLMWDGLRQPAPDGDFMPKKTQLVLSLFITFFMALVMSGIMGFLNAGPAYLAHWPVTFITAWPIAFIVSQLVNPLAFKLAFLVAPPRRA